MSDWPGHNLEPYVVYLCFESFYFPYSLEWTTFFGSSRLSKIAFIDLKPSQKNIKFVYPHTPAVPTPWGVNLERFVNLFYNNVVFWHVTPWSLVEKYQSFRDTFRLQLEMMETTKTLSQNSRAPEVIRTGDLPNASHKHRRLNQIVTGDCDRFLTDPPA
jgi:hypothetical protein